MNDILRQQPEQGSAWREGHSLGLALLLIAIFLLEAFLPGAYRFWHWLVNLVLLALFALLAGHGVTGLWLGLLIDSRNKLSLWTVLILSAFLTAVLTNIDRGHPMPLSIEVPLELWLLMGITTSALVGSPLIVQARKDQPSSEEERASALRQLARQAVDVSRVAICGKVITNAAPEAAHWSDLFRGSETHNAGLLDLGKLQMFFFTLILLLAYGAGLATLFGSEAGPITALPAIDSGMLALLGISHAGYLVSKAAPLGGTGGAHDVSQIATLIE